MSTISIITAMDPADRAAVHQLLHSHRLPVDGLDEHHVHALVAKDGSAVVGSIAVEQYGKFGLVRSAAVAESHRGRALGTRLTHAAIDLARSRNLEALYLLTETASGFFPRFGFIPVVRADIPAEVKRSVEFTTACPARAQTFELSLKGVSDER